jgi:hypothetical protein
MKGKSEPRPLKGRCVVFMVGRTEPNLESLEASDDEAESEERTERTVRSSPNYPDVIPKEKVIRRFNRAVAGYDVQIVVKNYPPDVVMVEAAFDFADLESEPLLEVKGDILADGRSLLDQYRCNGEFDEEYAVYCISDYVGDPEVYLTLHGERIACLLKNERIPLDEDEIRATLQINLKYAKDDLTIVDWDGAFVFDPKGEFEENIELFEIANLQLLRSRMLDEELDGRLRKTVELLRRQPSRLLFRSWEVRALLKEVIQIRTESILESEAIEHNIKLIGDWYSARLYNLISKRFHLDDWKANITQKLDVLEDIYTMASQVFSVSLTTTIELALYAGWVVLLIGWFTLLFMELRHAF